MTRLLTGKLPKRTDPRTLQLRRYLAAASAFTPPASVNWTTPGISWGMLGNDTKGDCTIAAQGHAAQAWSELAVGVEAQVTTAEVLTAYFKLTGGQDTGAVLIDALNQWRSSGVAGHKILAFAEIRLGDDRTLEAAIDLFGGAYVGLTLPSNWQDAIDAGRAWADTSMLPNPSDGHCVWLVGYNATGPVCVTWGQLQQMSWAFWHKYGDEAYAVLSHDWLTAADTAPSGVDLQQLGADIAAITGHNPIPAPTPPAPTPTPTPAPVPPTPDPGAATFHVSPAVAARVVALAARAHLTPDEWVDRRLAAYLHIAE